MDISSILGQGLSPCSRGPIKKFRWNSHFHKVLFLASKKEKIIFYIEHINLQYRIVTIIENILTITLPTKFEIYIFFTKNNNSFFKKKKKISITLFSNYKTLFSNYFRENNYEKCFIEQKSIWEPKIFLTYF